MDDGKMNIYVDFDDCLCETARFFSVFVKELYDLDIPYEKIKYFNLQKSFSLTEEKYQKMMEEAHRPEKLLSFEETPGAVQALNSWIDAGHDVKVITGRPLFSYEPSRKWLDDHNLKRVKLFCLNKYGRENHMNGSEFSLELQDFYKMHFDFAVEDSPAAFKILDKFADLKVLVFDRPWNHEFALPNSNYTRCLDWEKIQKITSRLD